MIRRKKRKSTKRALGIRGGFAAPRIPRSVKNTLLKELENVTSKHASPERLHKFIGKVIDKAAAGKSPSAARFLKELSKPLAVKTADGIVKLVKNPTGGILGKEGSKSPLVINTTTKLATGMNQLSHRKIHKVNFTSGDSNSRWMRDLERLNGGYNTLVKKTILDDQVGARRTSLNFSFGFNQKSQLLMDPTEFGFVYSDITSLVPTEYNSPTNKDQNSYLAIKSLTSKATFTNQNLYLPVKFKFSLVRSKQTENLAITAFSRCQADATDFAANTQVDGRMPIYFQLAPEKSTGFYRQALVDGDTPGIKCSEIFKSDFEIISSKSLTVGAGDSVRINYSHFTGSGLRIDRLLGTKYSSNFPSEGSLTYNLLVECEGVPVEANTPASPPVDFYRGTAPGFITFELEKSLHEVKDSKTISAMTNTGTSGGFLSSGPALRVFTNTATARTTRKFNKSYSATDIGIPVLSSTYELSAGKRYIL